MPFAGQTIKALDFTPMVFVDEGANETDFSNTTFETGATVVGISFMVPTSGRGTVHWYARFGSSSADNANVSIHVRTGSTINAGTTVSGPSENDSLENPGPGTDTTANRLGAGAFRPLSGLVAGDTYNIVMVHSVGSGTATIFHRAIQWVPSP